MKSPAQPLLSLCPADPSDEIGRFDVATDSDVSDAIARARQAQPGWRDAGFEARAAAIRRFRDVVAESAEELAVLIAREMGKAIWDARSEAKLVPAKVDVTLDAGMAAVAANGIVLLIGIGS